MPNISDGITATVGIVALISVVAGWVKVGLPRYRLHKQEDRGVKDVLLGRSEVTNPVTGEIAIARPSLGHWMATQDRRLGDLTEAVSKIADAHHRLDNVEVVARDAQAMAKKNAGDIADLRAGVMERIINRADSAAAWSAMEAAAKAEPSPDPKETP